VLYLWRKNLVDWNWGPALLNFTHFELLEACKGAQDDGEDYASRRAVQCPWVLEPWHIKASLRKAGFHCREECITLPKERIEGPDLKKESKDFYCTVTINKLEQARLKCRLHHWSTDPSERLPYVLEHWKLQSEPLLAVGSSSEKST